MTAISTSAVMPGESFSFTNIDVPGGTLTSVNGINEAGVVAGSFGYDVATARSQVFTYDNGVITPINLPGATTERAVAINASGEVAGNYVGTGNESGSAFHAFVYSNGVVTTIDAPGAIETDVVGLSASGEIAGNYYDKSTKVHAFVYAAGLFTSIDLPGKVAGVNDSGELVGSYGEDAASSHGFIYRQGVITTIDVPGWSYTQANAINDSGEVVGFYSNLSPTFPQPSGSIQTHAFIFDKGTVTTIDIPGAVSSRADGISAGGEVFGSYSDTQHRSHAFVYDKGAITTIDIPGATGTSVTAINSNNDVIGQYFTGTSSHAFIGQGPLSTPLLSISIRNTSTGESLVSTARRYSGPVAGLQNEYINITADNLYISAGSDNWFIHSGGGQDAIAVHGGTNVVDGGAGSNFMVAGSGKDMFFADDRAATTDIWSTLVGVHAGDTCTIWGLTQQDFDLSWTDGQGAAGFTGLTLHATAPGKPEVSMTLVGYSTVDRDNGRLSVTFDTEPVSGSAYMLIQANA